MATVTGPADIVSELQREWSLLFDQRDIEGLVSLYSHEFLSFRGQARPILRAFRDQHLF